MVAQPGGKPTTLQLLTFYLMQYILYAAVLVLQFYNCYYICRSSSSSAVAAKKKRAAASKFMILAVGILVLWSPMIINRVEFLRFPGFGEIQNHSERLEGFLFSTLLVLLNQKLRQGAKKVFCVPCKKGEDDLSLQTLSKGLIKERRGTSLSKVDPGGNFRLSIQVPEIPKTNMMYSH